jgi:hypothetical protein
VTITLKKCMFLCFKTSGVNGVLDIFWESIRKYKWLYFWHISRFIPFLSREKWRESELNE